ncbi:hypothetical protein HMH05_25875 [Pseudomonas sp. SbB1]|uniref:Uncharacterized protein n=2 Tax=Pseudomonas TaxID=286 RepID=B0KI90_PSEPG|nr:hypothetical protein PputGB1_1763 [Pseudomonas putida GB-1]MBP0710777.1 hypothetical protein [Pseudomonas sp. T34]NOG91226.1 hypothetical protein [Pseudomonas sp. SbB1]HDS1715558.1 hypothetical protein [Pseudomonas putida]HDS1754063.1 hypothetical protein [Pseudomonas putida]
MGDRHGKSKPGEFLPGIVMPPEIHGLLRMRVTQVEVSDTPVNCLIAQARAESLVEALEVLRAVPADAIERLYLVIESTTQSRLAELGSQH